MKPTVAVSLALAALAAVALISLPARSAAQTAAGPRTIEIKASDNMKYDVTTIQAKRGELLRVRLIGAGTMPKIAMSHNFILLKKGVDAKAFADKAISARATAYVPPELTSQVIVASSVIGNGEKTEVNFKAPSVPGRYEYICTFPGHFAVGMKGVLIVK
jgi:azurin